ncbi:hypothetical protein JCM8202_000582 [Rhodotorula sphaerocarpa]
MQVRRSRPFHPPANRDSFKDLLVFEERLKQNAQRLQKQRRKYEAFLFTLTGVIAYLGYYVFVLPSIYSLVHYSNVAMLLVAATTLVLFFATGMYSEKIAYAHKFVPQANRALRPFNIYLNTRRKPRLAFLTRWFNSTPSPAGTASGPSSRSASPSGASTPAGHVRKGSASVGEASVPSEGRESGSAPLSRQTSTTSIESAALSDVSLSASSGGFRSPPASPPLPSQDLPSEDSRPPTPSRDPVTRAPSSPSPSPPPPSRTAVPLPPIPPSQNPRGELIFSSRVTPQFREGYERYRGEWERRRSEARKQQQGQLSGRVVARVYGRMGAVFSGFGRRFGSGGARAEEEKVAGAGREDAGSRSEKEGMLRLAVRRVRASITESLLALSIAAERSGRAAIYGAPGTVAVAAPVGSGRVTAINVAAATRSRPRSGTDGLPRIHSRRSFSFEEVSKRRQGGRPGPDFDAGLVALFEPGTARPPILLHRGLGSTLCRDWERSTHRLATPSTSTAPTSAPQTSTDISTTASASRVRAESFSDLLTLEGEATADGLNGTGLLGPAGRLPRLEGSNSMRRGG